MMLYILAEHDSENGSLAMFYAGNKPDDDFKINDVSSLSSALLKYRLPS